MDVLFYGPYLLAIAAALWIGRRYGQRSALAWFIVTGLLFLAIAMIAWWGSADALAKGAWTAAAIVPTVIQLACWPVLIVSWLVGEVVLRLRSRKAAASP